MELKEEDLSVLAKALQDIYEAIKEVIDKIINIEIGLKNLSNNNEE